MICLVTSAWSTGARALVHFDFEQKFYVHPGHQTWDFSLVRADSLYHIFYHTALDIPTGSRADTIWHATSADLARWGQPEPILPSGTAAWDSVSVWAPDIFRDEANQRWVLAYTGADTVMNQSMGLAYSPDLFTWTPEPANPVLTPDPALYLWGPDRTWSDFRDPFVWREENQWHVLVTAKQWLGAPTGVLFHGVSDDLVSWQDAGVFFANDGADPWRVLESPQYHVINGRHHLLFGEYDTIGITHLSAVHPDSFTMATRTTIDNGYAPELDEFDPGVRMLSRIVPYGLPDGVHVSYVVRFDTLLVSPDGTTLTVHRPHPLDAGWEIHTGVGAQVAPTWGDTPLWRGEPSSGLVGNGWFSSNEYYQGPLSGIGTGFPGAQVGGGATCELLSRPFVVEGDRMDLLVGGGEDLERLYVALVDAVTDSVLRRSTGRGTPLLEPRHWDLAGLRGRLCRIRIMDDATGPDDILNVDEIVELHLQAVAAAPTPSTTVTGHRAYPNPANPRVRIRFRLDRPGTVVLRVHDLRGRLVWAGSPLVLAAGEQDLSWSGVDRRGRAAATGIYFYSLVVDGTRVAGGKLSLVR